VKVKEDISMIRKTHAVIALASAAVAAGILQSAPAADMNLSHAELTKMIRSAHTPQEYQALAGYFRSRQVTFEKQAQEEKVEWDRRSQNVIGPAAKFPRPVDSSRNRYEYFTYEAQQMSQQAAHYESLSANAAQ
jgi:hypothetical protein